MAILFLMVIYLVYTYLTNFKLDVMKLIVILFIGLGWTLNSLTFIFLGVILEVVSFFINTSKTCRRVDDFKECFFILPMLLSGISFLNLNVLI